MNHKKNNLIFSFFVFFLIGLFSIASFSALNLKQKPHGNKGKQRASFKVTLKEPKNSKGKSNNNASGLAKISYDARKGKNNADMKLSVKRLPTIFPAGNYTEPHFYEGWFFMEDNYVVSTGAFNTDWKKEGNNFVTFKPNNMDEVEHNLSAAKVLKITKEPNDGDQGPSGNVVLSGSVTNKFKKLNPYKTLYGGTLK